jgi:hypothetical protein
MYTSLVGVALAAALSPAANPAPTWMTDYRQAREVGAREQKPLVVVLGSEGSPWAKLAKATEADPALGAALRDKFVCLSVDTATEAGQSLARQFQIAGPGLVISDRSGAWQAYRTAGEVPADQLGRTLTAYSGTVVESMKVSPQTGAPAGPGVAPGVPVQGGFVPGVAPGMQPYYPQQPFYPGMGRGGCPNCH